MKKNCPKCGKFNELYKTGYNCRYCGYERIDKRDKHGNLVETDPEKTKLKRRIAELEEQVEKLLAEKNKKPKGGKNVDKQNRIKTKS